MVTVKAITRIQTRKNGTNHWVLYSLFIMTIALEPFFSDSQALRAIRHLLGQHSMYAPSWKLN